MKRIIMCLCLVTFLTGASAEIALDEASVTPEKPHVTVPDLKQLKSELDKWIFLRTTLEFHYEQAQSWINVAGDFVETYSDRMSEIAAAPLTLLAGLFVNNRFGFRSDEELYLWLSTASVGTVLYYLFTWITPRISRLFARHTAVAAYTLNNFMDGWEDYRSKCPAEVYSLFDNLMRDYETNDSLVSISDQQALLIVDTITRQSALAEKTYETFLKHTAHKNQEVRSVFDSDIDALRNALSSMLKVSLIATEAVTLDRSSVDLKAQKSQWEYLANQLGILNASHEFGTAVTKFFNEFEVPLVVGIGLPVGAMVGTKITKALPQISEIDTDIIRAGRIIGALAGAVVMDIASRLLGTTNAQDWYDKRLLHFIDGWYRHRRYCPAAVQPMFDQLSSLYQRNNRHLDLEEKFTEELYRMIAKIWLKISALPNQDVKD